MAPKTASNLKKKRNSPEETAQKVPAQAQVRASPSSGAVADAEYVKKMASLAAANDTSTMEFMALYMPNSTIWDGNKIRWPYYYLPKRSLYFNISLKQAGELVAKERIQCFKLIEESSKKDYENSNLGWHAREKKKEMQLIDLRYLLVKEDETKDDIVAFISFMPTEEDNTPVLYVYEIHMAERFRGLGLGVHLMRIVMAAAEKIDGIEKTMLQCFTSNARAFGFYTKLGYTEDEYNPEPIKVGKKTIPNETIILSRPVDRGNEST